jgi:hypothetical protein
MEISPRHRKPIPFQDLQWQPFAVTRDLAELWLARRLADHDLPAA